MSIVHTGYPRYRFEESLFFDWALTDLYRTKLPYRVETTKCSDGRLEYTYSWSDQPMSHPLPVSLRLGAPFCGGGPVAGFYEPGWYVAPEIIPSSHRQVSYDQAPPMTGYTSDEIVQIEGMRTQMLNLKIAVLGELKTAIQPKFHSGLWERCLRVFTGMLTAREAIFLARIDKPQFLNSYQNPSSRSLRSVGPINGGLQMLLNRVGHFESEITIGVMHKTKRKLKAVLGPGEYGIDRVNFATAIYAFADWPELTEAMQLCKELIEQEGEFFSAFSALVQTARAIQGRGSAKNGGRA